MTTKAQLKAVALFRVKMASHAHRIMNLRDELATYDLKKLSKQAAASGQHTQRLKVAALVRQLDIEKKALASSVMRTLFGELKHPGLVQKAMSGMGNFIGSGVKGAYGLGSSAVRGAAPHIGNAMTDSAKAIGSFARKNPREAFIGGSGLGLIGGYNAQNIGSGIQSGASGISSGISNLGTGMYNYGKGIAQIPSDIGGGLYSALQRLLGNNPGAANSRSAGGSNDYQKRFTNYRLRPNRL